MSDTATGSAHVNNFDYGKLKDRNYKGEDYFPDKDLVKGPQTERRCTDCLFMLIFLAFLGGMGYMTTLGYIDGNADIMLAPIMPTPGTPNGLPGLICGHSVGVENLKRLYVPDLETAISPITNFFKAGQCVEACPQEALATIVCFDQNSCNK